MCTSTAVVTPSLASLLSCEASVLILHFSLAAFLQHFEDTLSGAGVRRGPGEPRITQVVEARGAVVVGPGDLHSDRAEDSRGVTGTEYVFLPEAIPLDRRQDSHR